MSDMKDMFSVRGGFKSLNENVFKFFQQLRSTQGLENSGNDRIPNFVCSPLTLIVDAIERMTATRIHRLWVVDGDHDDRVVGVVSLSDLMQLFAKEI